MEITKIFCPVESVLLQKNDGASSSKQAIHIDWQKESAIRIAIAPRENARNVASSYLLFVNYMHILLDRTLTSLRRAALREEYELVVLLNSYYVSSGIIC